jgi:hypothetical protein
MLSRALIDGYVNNGDFIAISINKSADENYQFMIADKKLSLKLHKDLYYSLNAVHLSKHQTKNEQDKFTFSIDLVSGDVEKVRQELQNAIIEKLEVNFMWNPLSNDICSSSIAKFFTNMDYSVNAVNNQSANSYLFGLKFPKIPATKAEDYEWDEFTECVGMMMLGCDFEENSCSSYQLPEDTIEIGRGQVIHFKGFIPHFILEKSFKEMAAILKGNSQIPFIALSAIAQTTPQKKFDTKSIILSSENIYIAE